MRKLIYDENTKIFLTTGPTSIITSENYSIESSDIKLNNLTKKIEVSGEKTGDKVWSMPLDAEYDKMINTEIADMKNIGGMGAGSITAACFLQRHVENTPWAHLDIAGVTWLSSSTKTSPAGASGWGVKLLFDLTKNFDYKI